MDISDWRDERVHPYRLDPRDEPEPDIDDEPVGIGARLPATAIAVKRRAEETALEQQRARIAALRPSGPVPRLRRNYRPSRHRELATPALAWWFALHDTLQDWPEPSNDNDSRAPSRAAVMDRNPRPDAAETLMRQLPRPVRVATRILRKRREPCAQAPEVRYVYEWHPDDAEFVEYVADGFSWDEERIRGFRIAKTFRRPSRIGPFRFATARGKGVQFVREKGQDKAVPVPIYLGSITRIYGRHTGQDDARDREPENKAAVAERANSMLWFCSELRAVPAMPPKPAHRKRHPPIDWNAFAHLRGGVPLEQARAASGLPPADRCHLPGLPIGPAPSRLFVGLVSGMSSGDGAKSSVRRPAAPGYTTEDMVADKQLRERFRDVHPEHAALLDIAATAGSMSDLVASNDNKAGKRRLAAANAALEKFLAA